MQIYFKCKTLLCFFAFAAMFSLGQLQAQPGTWAISAGAGSRDYVTDILVDQAGNSYVTGYFTDSIRFENTSLIAQGENDIYLAKYNTDGNLMWAQSHGWYESEFARKLAFDWNDNILLVGEFQDSTILAGDTILSLDTLWYGPYAQTYDVYMMEFEPNGTPVDVFSDGWFSSERIYDIEVDGNADRVLAVTWHTLSFWENIILGKGYHDGMIVSLDSSAQNGGNVNGYFKNRNHAWGAQFDEAREVEVIGDSLYVLAGTFQDTCYFRDSTLYGITDFEDDIYITTHDDTAGFAWALWGGSPGKDRLTGLDHDDQGNLYATGTFWGDFTIGNEVAAGAGNLDGFVAKMDLAGNVQWAIAVGGEGFDGIEDIAVRSTGDVIVTGYFQGEMTIGNTVLQAFDSLDQDIFVASISGSNGAINWAWKGGGAGIDIAQTVEIGPANSIYIAGAYSGTTSIGQQSLTSNGSDDIFVFKMDANGAVSTVEETLPVKDLTLFPNPATSTATVAFQLESPKTVDLRISGLDGKVMFEEDYGKLRPGSHQMDLDLKVFAPGFYLVNLMVDGESITRKLVIAQ